MAGLLRSQDAYDPIRNIREWQLKQLNVQPSDYIDETAEHNEIAELSSSLLALFKGIVLALSEQTEIPKDARISIERSRSALILWSDGFGIAQGRLNDTFNKSHKLRYKVFKNLLHIGRVLVERLVPVVNVSSEKLQVLCSSVQASIEAASGLVAEESCRESDDSSSDGASTFSDDDIYEIAEDLKTDTFVLSSLEPLFKSPIFDSQHENGIDGHALTTWSPEKHFSDKIENRFPCADVPLTSHLGRANYERYLRCQVARDSQEGEEPLPATNQEEENRSGTIIADTKFHDSGVGTSIALTMSYAETTMSYNHDGQSVRIPPLSKEAKSGLPFTCIACGRMVVITNNSAWKRHIYLDLQPYMCLDMSCPYSSSTFESREKWISHLALDHEMGPKWKSAECPLCREETGNGKTAITRHLSKHLEEISLSALPVEVNSNAESENSSELGDAGSSLRGRPTGSVDGEQEARPVEYLTSKGYLKPEATTIGAENLTRLGMGAEAAQRAAESEAAEAGSYEKIPEFLAIYDYNLLDRFAGGDGFRYKDAAREADEAGKQTKLAPIRFKDAVGRKFILPFHLCHTWQGMEDLIKQACLKIEVLGPHVQEGRYDLSSPNGDIILPSVWERVVEPGWDITMTLWPLDKTPPAGSGPEISKKSNAEERNPEKNNPIQNRINSKDGQNFFASVKTYFKDQPDKLTRFRTILAVIATTHWVPEAWRRACFECRVAEVECDAKPPDPCTRCRLKKSSCAVQFAAVSGRDTVVNTEQIRQGIINIGRLCDGYPSFMHELNNVMPPGYRVEVVDASTVRLFAPDNEPTIIPVGISEHLTTGIDNQADGVMGPNQQDKRIPGAFDAPSLEMARLRSGDWTTINDLASKLMTQATAQQKANARLHFLSSLSPEKRAEFEAQKKDPLVQWYQEQAFQALKQVSLDNQIQQGGPSDQNNSQVTKMHIQQRRQDMMDVDPKSISAHEESRQDSTHPIIDTKDTPGLSYDELKKVGLSETYLNKVKHRFDDSPYVYKQLLEILRDTQKYTHPTQGAYLAAKDLFGSNSDLIDELQTIMAKGKLKLDEYTVQRTPGVSQYGTEAPKEAPVTKGDKIRVEEVMKIVDTKAGSNDSNEPRYCLCNRGGIGIMIRCDNVDSCKYKWFHLECVGLSVAPSSKIKWHCPDCRSRFNIGEEENIPPQPLQVSAQEMMHIQAQLQVQANQQQVGPNHMTAPQDPMRIQQPQPDLTSPTQAAIPDATVPKRQNNQITHEGVTRHNEMLQEVTADPDPAASQTNLQGIRNKEQILSIGRIEYPFPNPDIYIWPPDSNDLGEEESKQASSSTFPPPLPPPVIAKSESIADPRTDYNGLKLPSASSDGREIFDREYPDHGPFLASPSPNIYTKQLPPVFGGFDGGNPAEVDSSEEISDLPTSLLAPSSPFAPPVSSRLRDTRTRGFPCEAEPQEKRICFKTFSDYTKRNRHYRSFHKEYAKEQGLGYACDACGKIFTRRNNLDRHVKKVHSEASTEDMQSSTPPPFRSALDISEPTNVNNPSAMAATRQRQLLRQPQAFYSHEHPKSGGAGVDDIILGVEVHTQQFREFAVQFAAQQQSLAVSTPESTHALPRNIGLQSRDVSADDPNLEAAFAPGSEENGAEPNVVINDPESYPASNKPRWLQAQNLKYSIAQDFSPNNSFIPQDLTNESISEPPVGDIQRDRYPKARDPRDERDQDRRERELFRAEVGSPVAQYEWHQDDKNRELFHAKVETRAAQESAAQDKDVSPPPEESSAPVSESVPNRTQNDVAGKTKEHVASTCLPCKMAHLRCDARRPCSRCLDNGKEDACVDVPHKRRGRPRLRDERDAKFDSTG